MIMFTEETAMKFTHAPLLAALALGATLATPAFAAKDVVAAVASTFTTLDPTFHDLVVFNKTAERAYAQFKVGDQFLASGYIHEYEVERPEGSQIREQFVARRTGHDTARTRYSIDRTPAKQPEPPTDQLSVVSEPARAVGL